MFALAHFFAATFQSLASTASPFILRAPLFMNALTDLCLSCLSFRHCRDCFNVLQNHTFRQKIIPMCFLVVAVSLGIKTRLKQCHLVVLMNTAHFGITCFCLLRLCLIETSPCYIPKAPMCVSLRFGLIHLYVSFGRLRCAYRCVSG